MELSEIWLWYCGERVAERDVPPVLIPPMKAVELFFDLFPMFSARADAIRATRYDTAFDGEADEALAHMARFDTFEAWDEMSAGAWRVMNERLLYATTVAVANEAAGNPIIARLPAGLDRQSQARALMLQFLLGGARTIDRRLLPSPPDGSLPEFPAATPLRRQ